MKADQTQIIASGVSRVLHAKVDRDGKESNYSYDNKTYIQWLCETAIRECAKKAIAEWVEKSKPKFEQQFLKELNKKSPEMTRLFIDGVTKCISSNWGFNLSVSFANKE